MNIDDLDREARAQAEAERAERTNATAGGDPRVDRYRLIVRALRQPLQPQLPADFAARVVAAAAGAEQGDGFEDWLVVLLMLGLGLGALFFVVPALAVFVHSMVSIRLPAMPWHQLTIALACIGVVWAIDSGWTRMHPDVRGH
jgi:hypothetical protein